MLRDVVTKVSDGLLGFATEKGTGIFVDIGASPVVSDGPVIITGNMGVTKIRERLGLSPLADSVMDEVENGANRIYCYPVAASVAGTVGEVKASRADGGTMTVEGTPNNAYGVIIKITGKGNLNTALFVYSIDGGYSYSDDVTVPVGGKYEIAGTGLTVTFAEAADSSDAAPSFLLDDSFSFATTAPQMSSADALAAIDKLKVFSELYEFVHIIGESAAEMWAAVSAAQIELEADYHKPLMFVLEAFVPNENEKVEDYALRLEAARKQIKNRAIQVVAARALYTKLDGTTREQNCAGIVCGLYAKTNVQQSIGRTRDTAGMGIKKAKMAELAPRGIEEYVELLDAADFLTFREYDGLDDYFVTNARMMCPDGSDYRYAEDTRVLHKIIREVRKAALPLLQDDIDVTDTQGELERRARYLEAPLDEMVRAQEISDFEIVVPEGQDIIKTEKMLVVIRYISRGYIREIEIDLGRANVSVMA